MTPSKSIHFSLPFLPHLVLVLSVHVITFNSQLSQLPCNINIYDWFGLQEDNLKSKPNGHIYELEVHLESIEANHEEIQKMINSLKINEHELVKSKKHMSFVLEEIFSIMK